jgi:hypothetical protein
VIPNFEAMERQASCPPEKGVVDLPAVHQFQPDFRKSMATKTHKN